MQDPRDATIGQLFLANQELQSKLNQSIEVIRLIKTGEISLDRVIAEQGTFTVLPVAMTVAQAEAIAAAADQKANDE